MIDKTANQPEGLQQTGNALAAQAAFLFSYVVKSLTFIIISRFLSKEEFGRYAFAMSITILFFLISNAGIAAAQIKMISRNNRLIAEFLSSIALFQGATILITAIFFAGYVEIFIDDEILRIYLYFAIGFAASEKTKHYLLSSLNGLGMIPAYAGLLFGDILIEGGMIIAIISMTGRVVDIFLVYLIKNTVVIGLLLVISLVLVDRIGRGEEVVSAVVWKTRLGLELLFSVVRERLIPLLQLKKIISSWKGLWQFTFALILFDLTYSLYQYLAMVILERLTGPVPLADYSVCNKTASFFNFMVFALAVGYLPIFSRKDRMEGILEAMRQVVTYLFFLLLPMFVGSYFVAGDLLAAIWGDRYSNSTLSLYLCLSLGAMFLSLLAYPIKLFLIGQDRLVVLNGLTVIFLVGKGVVAVFLIERSGYRGAIQTDLILEGIFAGVLYSWFFLRHKEAFPRFWQLLRYCCTTALMGIVLYLVPLDGLWLILIGTTIYFCGVAPFEGRYVYARLLRRKGSIPPRP